MMKNYTVQIQAIEYYTIEVQAENEEQAEEHAWRMFPHHSPLYGENNVTEITCEEKEDE
jgi:hypothetical protein